MNNIDYETIISSFDDKGTLLKWLKTIDAELQGAKVTSSSWRVVEGEERNTAYLTLTTSNGVSFETEGLVMPKLTSAIIIDVINQAIEIYDAEYGGSQTLQEFVEHIENKLNSVGATEGQVLTSNGDGTSAWQDASEYKLYRRDISFGSTYPQNATKMFFIAKSNSLPPTFESGHILSVQDYRSIMSVIQVMNCKTALSGYGNEIIDCKLTITASLDKAEIITTNLTTLTTSSVVIKDVSASIDKPIFSDTITEL